MGKQEVKLTLFGDDKILYIENPEQAISKLLILINAFGSYRIKKKINRENSCIPIHKPQKIGRRTQENNAIYHCIKNNKIPRNKPT